MRVPRLSKAAAEMYFCKSVPNAGGWVIKSLNKLLRQMKIVQLSRLPANFFENAGNNGYLSDHIFKINSSFNGQNLTFDFELIKLEIPFEKHWAINEADIIYYNRLIEQGHSFAVIDTNGLIGVIICQEMKWNNTLQVEHLIINRARRGQGIGSMLMTTIIEHSSQKCFRLIAVETQNTNVPAIKFYEKQGFKITGLNLTLYDGKENSGEIAIFMSCHLGK
jgi:ribosomal protein S18 acetylase RimI-like enzyme